VIEIAKIAISLAPVFIFLVALIFLDSYKLVSLRSVLLAVLAGVLAALACLFINGWLSITIGATKSTYSYYFAPLIEETAKALFIIYLIRLKKVGFMVDAAIFGFAVGAGFSLIENIYYLFDLQSAHLAVWVIRGFGTAAIHATTMALFGIVSKRISDEYSLSKLYIFIPGFILAVLIHSLFNHFVFSPVWTTLMLLVILPLLVVIVFERSERATSRWLGVGFDADQELLRILTTGLITESRIGKYLESLQARFPGEVLADMFCLLRINTELALRAKGILMIRQAGIKMPDDPEIQEKIREMKYLEKSIGKTGKLAILPFLHKSSRDLWQLQKVK
jgi:RsiW-degrading membrane proteinase PrsW (M82 family)